jgi:hypothetical protein
MIEIYANKLYYSFSYINLACHIFHICLVLYVPTLTISLFYIENVAQKMKKKWAMPMSTSRGAITWADWLWCYCVFHCYSSKELSQYFKDISIVVIQSF